MRIRSILSCIVLMVGLSGCGNEPASRAITGYGWGAAAGTLLWWPLGVPGLGFVVGGTLGAATGGLTAPEYVYFGDVPWEDMDYNSRVVPYDHGVEAPDWLRGEPKPQGNPYVRRPVNKRVR